MSEAKTGMTDVFKFLGESREGAGKSPGEDMSHLFG